MKRRAPVLAPVLVATAWAAGALAWLVLLDGGRIPFGALDWYQEFMRTGVFREALQTGRIPLHWQPVGGPPERMFGILDLIVSPWLPLLPWLSNEAYVTLHLLLLYTIGVAGVAWLARRRGWSAPAFVAGWLLFTLNGHITAHVSVGHLMWTGEFLLPCFIGWCADWAERGPDRPLAGRLALLLAAMAYLGAFHLCLWCAVFLLLLAAPQPREWAPAGVTLGLAGILTALRWLPATVQYGRLGTTQAQGFPDVETLAASLLHQWRPEDVRVPGVGAWELDTCIGFGGAALLLLGVVRLIRSKAGGGTRWAVPIIGMILLAYDGVYTLLLSSWPGFCAEFAVTRLLILGVLALVPPAGDALSEGWRRSPLIRGAIVAGLAVLAVELGWHLYGWRVSVHPAGLPPSVRLVTMPDPLLVRSILLGAGLAALGLLATVGYLRRPASRRRG